MSECRELEPLLAPYIDGEAGADDCARIEAHVHACSCCRGRVAAQRSAREAVCARRTAVRGSAPEALKARCASYARAAGTTANPGPARPVPVRSLPVYRRWLPMTAAATLVLSVTAVFGLGLTEKAQALAFQGTVDHVKCARFNMPAAPGDPVEAAEKWHARFGWEIKVPPSLREAGLELRGVRRCAVTDGRVAHLMYSWNGEPLSVYVLPARLFGESVARVDRFGHESLIWSQNDRTYIVVAGRRVAPALDRVVAHVRSTGY